MAPVRANPIVAHGMDGISVLSRLRSGNQKLKGCGRFPIKSEGFSPTPNSVHCRSLIFSAKHFLYVKINLITHDKIRTAAQLGTKGLRGYHIFCLCQLPLIIFFCFLAMPPRKIGRFHIGPTQILVPVLAIAFALLLSVAHVFAFCAPAV
jgi:hypothetical protein